MQEKLICKASTVKLKPVVPQFLVPVTVATFCMHARSGSLKHNYFSVMPIINNQTAPQGAVFIGKVVSP